MLLLYPRFRLFLLFVSAILVLAVSAACDGDSRNRRVARGENYVSDPDHLFFRNTRSRDYQSITLEEGADAYYHDELADANDAVIIDNWIEDRATLLVDGEEVSVTEARGMRDSLRRLDRSAALEVVEDYLRLVGN